MKQRLYTLLYILAACWTIATAQPARIFHKYMAADGLSDNNVLCGLRDSYGFMWLGTNNGLNCFDGTQNTIYRNMVENDASYENNIITALFEYEGDIWLGGSFGLCVYDRETNTFRQFTRRTRYGVNISSTVQRIAQGPGGLIWIATLGQGLFTYAPTTGQLTQDSRHGSFFSDILTVNGFVFLTSLQGNVVVYSDAGNYISQYSIPGYVSDKNSICMEHIGSDVYIGCDRGLYCLRPGQQTIEPIPTTLGSTAIRSLRAKGSGELLIGTEEGIYLMQIDSRRISRFDNPADHQGALSDAMVNHLMWDADSTLWVMTQMGGVCYMPTPKTAITAIGVSSPDDGRKQMVRSFCEMPDGRLWVGTDKGLHVFNPQTQQLAEAQPSLRQEINVLMPDGDDLWIGTRHDGIYVLNTVSRQMRHYQYSASKPYTITSNEINALLRTRGGDIYVGTSWSLCRFDRRTENFMWFAEIGSMTNVTSLTEDTTGCVWAASSNHGLFRQTSPRAGFRNYLYSSRKAGSVASNNITTVFADSQGTIWVATNGNGLCRYNPENDGFEPFGGSSSVFQEQQVFFVTEDQQHCLWMGLESCMAKIDSQRNPANPQLLKSPMNLMREQKPHNSAYLTRQGEIYAGRNGVLVHFRPEQIVITDQRMPVYVTSVTLPYHAGNDQPECNNLYTDGSLTLPFADNSFTLHFSSPRFMGDTDVRFEYMLSGVDQTWARGTRNAEATYANVQPGDYEFLLREAGSDQPDAYARLHITILPPWYRTTLAYIAYALLIAAAIFWAVRRYNRLLKRRYNRQMQEFQTRQEKENFESKISFFINLVHEIRTPLTLMSLPLEAIENLSEKVKVKSEKFAAANQSTTDNTAEANSSLFTLPSSLNSHIAAIRRNMNYLLGITNQLLDFQKAERGRVELDLHNCDVNQLLSEAYSQFEDAMQMQDKQLQLQLPETPIKSAIDREKVLKVLMNLMGNAFKYARSEVILRLEQTGDDRLCISVIDDGPGVPPEERDKIFDVYHQIAGDATAKHLGTGLGLAYARMLAQAHGGELTVQDPPGGGSDFRLSLPITSVGQEHADDLRIPMESAEFEDETAKNDLSRTFRILIVEDNEELLQMTCDALRPHFRILKARDGEEALDLLRHQDIDVIVSDVMMPRMDGNELTRRVKHDINYSHIPIILLTAKTSVEAKLEGMESGADIYLEKPFSVKQLHLQIMSLLRMRQTFHERMRQIDGTPAAANDGELGMNQQDLQFMERLQRMVAENMRDEEFSIDLLAEQMNMSRSSFYRKIKALTDLTPIEYLKTQRLERAAQLLRQGGRITEVAEQVGFTSSSYFAKCFKARFGLLPKDYAAGKTSE